MKFASFHHRGRSSWGLVDGDAILDLGAPQVPDLKRAVASGLARHAARAAEADRIPLSALAWLPVIPNPDKILCIGINYEDHRQETGRERVGHPTVFTRFASSQTGHATDLIRPSVSTKLDYEGELAVIIGQPGRHIDQSDAMAHVAGFSCYMDGSVRDWQQHTQQYTPGKNFPATGGFGPWLVTPDEMDDLPRRRVRTRLNGLTVQDAPVSDMIFGIARQIAYLSAFTRLEPGDVIATGTPGGVGSKREPPVWLRPGDTVEVEIDGIGILRHGVADEIVPDRTAPA